MSTVQQWTADTETGRRHLAAVVALLILCALAVRWAAGHVIKMELVSDAKAYWTMALNLSAGRGLIDNFGNYAYYSAGYPLLLAGLFAAFGPGFDWILHTNVLLGGLSVYLIFRAGQALFDSAAAGLLAGAFWAFDLPATLYVTYIAKENLMIPLMIGLVWITVAYPRSSRPCLLAGLAGAITGALAITGMTGCVLAVALLAVMILQSRTWGARGRALGIFAALCALTLAPWLYRNYQVLGEPVLNTYGGVNLYLGNNPAATGYFIGIEATPLAQTWVRLKSESGELVANRAAAEAAHEYIRQHPSRTLALSLRRAALFWQPPLGEGQAPRSVFERLMRLGWLVQFALIAVLAAIGLRTWRTTWPLWLSIVLYTVIHLPFFVMSRYRLPIMPVLCLIAAGSLLLIWRQVRSTQMTNQ